MANANERQWRSKRTNDAKQSIEIRHVESIFDLKKGKRIPAKTKKPNQFYVEL